MTILELAKQYLGTGDIPGRNSNPLILKWLQSVRSDVTDDDTAWCSAFVNFICRELGLETSNDLRARSWLNVGRPVSIKDAQPGDIVIMKRYKSDPGPEVIRTRGHVGFFVSANHESIEILGGNQKNGHNYDEVCSKNYDRDNLLGIRIVSRVNF